MVNKLIEIESFKEEQGHCWVAVLPDHLKQGDSAGRTASSELMLFEDGTSLGPARSAHELIRATGRGAFSHWGNELWFSTSDNTPPNSNRRRYVVVSEGVEEERGLTTDRSSSCGTAPVNYQPLDPERGAIEKDATYAIVTAQSYVDCLPGGQAYLRNRAVLELGPGPNLGAALVLLCWGAEHVAVADRFLVPFTLSYHVLLYQKLIDLLSERFPGVPLDPVLEVIKRKKHAAKGLTTYSSSLEALADAGDRSFDVTASNAVFEHLFDPRAAIGALYQLTACGGIGLHQVDFRDHRDFSRPLEFLLDDERSFALRFEQQHGETGSRIRPVQMQAMFKEAGFNEINFQPNLFVEEEYLSSFVPRLRASPASPFFESEIRHLNVLSGRFVVTK
ncbi:MAG: methyltransferase domain-containing protein [Burkholderiaceae bacterium]